MQHDGQPDDLASRLQDLNLPDVGLLERQRDPVSSSGFSDKFRSNVCEATIVADGAVRDVQVGT
jgi:hypothetical protein